MVLVKDEVMMLIMLSIFLLLLVLLLLVVRVLDGNVVAIDGGLVVVIAWFCMW